MNINGGCLDAHSRAHFIVAKEACNHTFTNDDEMHIEIKSKSYVIKN